MENLLPNTWWIDTKDRTWLLKMVPMTPFINEKKVLDFKPAGSVSLLELGKSEMIEQPYETIQEYISKGIFKPLIT